MVLRGPRACAGVVVKGGDVAEVTDIGAGMCLVAGVVGVDEVSGDVDESSGVAGMVEVEELEACASICGARTVMVEARVIVPSVDSWR